VSKKARVNGAKLIIDRLQYLTSNQSIPIFVLGDFNTIYGSTTYRYFTTESNLRDSLDHVLDIKYNLGKKAGNVGCDWEEWVSFSFHNWWGLKLHSLFGSVVQYVAFGLHNREVPTWNRYHVDWILYNPSNSTVEPIEWIMDTSKEDSQYPSDHFPVITLFRIK
jgi:hypothetical protein